MIWRRIVGMNEIPAPLRQQRPEPQEKPQVDPRSLVENVHRNAALTNSFRDRPSLGEGNDLDVKFIPRKA